MRDSARRSLATYPAARLAFRTGFWPICSCALQIDADHSPTVALIQILIFTRVLSRDVCMAVFV